MKLPRWFHLLGSPPHVYRLAERLSPWLGGLGCALLAVGTVWGLAIAPADYQQGESARILYIHPQTAYVGMMAYVVMAVAAAIGYVWRVKLAHAAAVSAAPLGAWFTFCALCTGAIWGRPTWGTYWQWGDPRIMFEALLLFLFLGYLALRGAFDDRDKADRVTRHSCRRRRREHPDHSLFRRVVELAPSDVDDSGRGRAGDDDRYADSVLDHVRRLHSVVLLVAAAAVAGRDSRARGQRSLDSRAGSGGRTVTEFLAMGEHGAYVWSAYGITLAVLIINVWLVRAKRRSALLRAQELATQAEVPRKQPTVRRLQ